MLNGGGEEAMCFSHAFMAQYVDTHEGWMNRALCSELDEWPAMAVDEKLSICEDCPVARECLEYSIEKKINGVAGKCVIEQDGLG